MSDSQAEDASFRGPHEFARSIIATVREPFLILDEQLRVVEANRAFHEAFGADEGGLVGRVIYELGRRRWDIPELRTLLQDVLAGRSAFRDFRLDGEFEGLGRRTMLLNARRAHRDGETILLAIEDITERVRSDEARRSIEDRWRGLFSGMAEGFFTGEIIRDPATGRAVDFRFLELNPAFGELTGLGVDETSGKTVREAIPGIQDDLIQRYARVVETGEAAAFEIRVPALDDRWYEVRARHLEGARFSVLFLDVSGRKAAEAERLRLIEHAAAQARVYESLLSHTPDFMYVIGTDHRFRYVNEALLAMWGRTPETTIGRGFSGLEYPEWLAVRHDQEIDRVIATRESVRSEVPFTGTNGERIYDYIFAPVLGPDGEVEAIAGSTRDITERKRQEDASRVLAAIVASSDDAIISEQLDGTITSWNASARRIFGYEADEIIGRSVSVLIPPEHGDEEERILSRIRRGERIEHYDTRRLTKDGRVIDLSITISPIRDAKGEIVGASKVARDITERKLAAERLRESEQHLRQMIDAVPQQVWTARPDGRLDYVNATTRSHVGEIAVEDGAVQWTGVVHPDDLPRSLEAWGRSLASGDPYEVEQRVLHQGSGEYRWHLSRARPVRNAEGRITRWFGTNTDIDARKRLEAAVAKARDEAEAANRMKDQFLATLSHELRTPLNAILGWAKILRSGRVDDEDREEGIAAIERNSIAQAQIIEDLLDISRIVSGNFKLEVQRVNIQEIIEAAIATAMPAAAAKQVRVHKLLDSLAGPVSGDPGRLQQVVWNLVTNAVKFTPKGGKVQVLLERVNSHIEISVVDTGIGIKPEFLPNVFDRFRQADSTTTRRHGGLGLGLSIVKQLVEIHGGTVRVKSPGEGQGATFTVTLPITVVHPEQAPPEKARPKERAGSEDPCKGHVLAGLRVLVLDDEPDARHLIRRVLTGCEAVVALASSALEALDLVESFRPDVIVSDIGMPDLDGYDFIRRVRAKRTSRDLPAAALTAFARADDRKQALLAGFQTHVAKPVDPAELVAVVASLAGRTGTA